MHIAKSSDYSHLELDNLDKSKADNFYKSIKFQSLLKKYSCKKNSYHAKLLTELGSMKLYQFSEGFEESILLVPSLINRSYIFDFNNDRSFINYFKNDFNVYLIDWNEPQESEYNFYLNDYIYERIIKSFEYLPDQKFHIIGYCLGGVISLLASKIIKDKVKSLSLIATPWNFDHFQNFAKKFYHEHVISYIEKSEILDPNSISFLFDSFDNYSRYSSCKQIDSLDETQLKNYSAIQYWMNNGISVAKNVAKEIFIKWPLENYLQENYQSILNQEVNSKNNIPVYITISLKDRIVPIDSSKALINSIKNCHVRILNTGHLGTLIGSKSKDNFLKPLKIWLTQTKL